MNLKELCLIDVNEAKRSLDNCIGALNDAKSRKLDSRYITYLEHQKKIAEQFYELKVTAYKTIIK